MKAVTATVMTILIIVLAAFSFTPTDTRVDVKDKYYVPIGVTYTGHMEHGLPEGFGLLKFDDGSYYSGEFSGGRFDGNGIFVSASGERLDGTFKEGVFVK